MRKALVIFGVLVCGLSGLSCGTGAPTQSPPAAGQISGSASCASVERQDLVFSGRLTGHVTCSTTPAACVHAWQSPSPPGGLVAPVSAIAGTTPVQLTVALSIADYKVGTYVAGDPGEGASRTSDYGVTLDGIGSWVSAPGGSRVVSAVDSGSASGTVDVRLQLRLGGEGTIAVTGSWRCSKPAGF